VRKPGPLTFATLALLILFGATDLAAELTGDGKGQWGETFSTLIAHLDRRAWYYRAGIGLLTVLLALHLTVQWP